MLDICTDKTTAWCLASTQSYNHSEEWRVLLCSLIVCPLVSCCGSKRLLYVNVFFPDEDAKIIAKLEQANEALTQELEEVKATLSQTEETLKGEEEQKTLYHNHMNKTCNSLMSTVKGLMAVLKQVSFD